MRVLCLLIVLFLNGCIQPLPTSESPSAPSPQTTDWEAVQPGIAMQSLRASNTLLRAVRIDPSLYTFRVHYNPGNPLTLDDWRFTLPDALLIVNVNFFTPEHTALGLLIADGQRYGTSYVNRGGTFFVQGGQAGLQPNGSIAPDTSTWSQAIQAFPMLVTDGRAAYQNASDTVPARRTVIGIDTEGQVIIMVTPGFGISLYELSNYLPVADLSLQQALNLDGGGSTMLYLAPAQSRVPSIDPVPAVLAVYARP